MPCEMQQESIPKIIRFVEQSDMRTSFMYSNSNALEHCRGHLINFKNPIHTHLLKTRQNSLGNTTV